MKSIFAVLPFCVALLSSASPLGDRAMFRRHTGAPLTRRYMMSSNFNYPEACSAGVVSSSNPGSMSVADNSTDMIPVLSNVTDSTPLDNSTVTTPDPTLSDNSTVTAVDNSTVTDSADTNATTSGVSKRYGYSDFENDWFNLCSSCPEDSSDSCFDYTISGYSALFAESDVCAQQETADEMITFVKSHGFSNSDDWIKVAVSYRRLARESVQLFGFYPSTPYCTVQPMNDELCGVWNEQPEGVSVGLYGGPDYPIVPFGDDASCPYGQTPDPTTCSCLDNFYGSVTNLPGAPISTMIDSTSTDTADMTDATLSVNSTSTDTADMTDATLSAVNSTSDATASDTASAASSTSDASATAASPDASATAQIDGNPNDPNGRRRRRF
ncbi:hypothetical protein GGX14DRAFT_592183 [Mycena pura]|uniref:Uncharacterized protein n=1 Tax=Mycena pura TaxID=153505 RepID=A0AAD6VSZ8_9AGAR|nr:hypothetical protein GGX14DRAFT_592183 [Mycena pura]